MTRDCDCAAAWREWEIQIKSNRVLAERVERLMALAASCGATTDAIEDALHKNFPRLRSAGPLAIQRVIEEADDA